MKSFLEFFQCREAQQTDQSFLTEGLIYFYLNNPNFSIFLKYVLLFQGRDDALSQ